MMRWNVTPYRETNAPKRRARVEFAVVFARRVSFKFGSRTTDRRLGNFRFLEDLAIGLGMLDSFEEESVMVCPRVSLEGCCCLLCLLFCLASPCLPLQQSTAWRDAR